MLRLTYLYIKSGHWTGEASHLFPALEHLVDESGNNIAHFTKINSLETIQVDRGNEAICYFSSLEKVPVDKELHVSPDLPIQVLPGQIALHIVNGDWENAAREHATLVETIENRPHFTVASIRAKLLGSVIANQADPEGIFVSGKSQHGDNTYQAVFCGLSHAKARAFAREAGGKLASADSTAETEFLQELIRNNTDFNTWWIGGQGNAVLTTNQSTSSTRPGTCLYPFIIEWEPNP